LRRSNEKTLTVEDKGFNFNGGENIERPSQLELSQLIVRRPARLSVQTAQGIRNQASSRLQGLQNQFAQRSALLVEMRFQGW
jgi:hypothetical protein